MDLSPDWGRATVPSARDGIPPFVEIYNQLLSLLDRRGLGPGDALPGEVELAGDLKTPREVLREALFLLEEDGYVTRDSSRLWIVAPRALADVGFADSFHRLLGGEVRASRRLYAAVEESSSFTRALLGSEQPCLVWETVFSDSEDRLLAGTLEFLRADACPDGMDLDTQVAREHRDVDGFSTLLEALGPDHRARLTPVLWRLVPVSRNTERLAWMDLPLHAIPALLTVVLAQDGVPVYVAKNLFDLGSFDLTVDLTRTTDR